MKKKKDADERNGNKNNYQNKAVYTGGWAGAVMIWAGCRRMLSATNSY